MRQTAHGHAGKEKPRLSTTGQALEGVRTCTPQCDAAERIMTLAGIRPDGLAVQNEEATAIFYEPDTVQIGHADAMASCWAATPGIA